MAVSLSRRSCCFARLPRPTVDCPPPWSYLQLLRSLLNCRGQCELPSIAGDPYSALSSEPRDGRGGERDGAEESERRWEGKIETTGERNGQEEACWNYLARKNGETGIEETLSVKEVRERGKGW